MQVIVQRRWRAFWIVLCLALLTVGGTHAAIITLNAKVTYSLLGGNGSPLADGSVVYIIGSGNSTIGDSGVGTANVPASNQMMRWGSPTSDLYIADSTLDDDEIIGFVTIGTGSSSNGTFQTAQFEFDDTEINYFYIRFFDSTDIPPVGTFAWGNSPIYEANNHPFGVENIDFAPNDNLEVGYTNNFVVIPEPGSGNLLLLLAGLAYGIRVSMKGRWKM